MKGLSAFALNNKKLTMSIICISTICRNDSLTVIHAPHAYSSVFV